MRQCPGGCKRDRLPMRGMCAEGSRGASWAPARLTASLQGIQPSPSPSPRGGSVGEEDMCLAVPCPGVQGSSPQPRALSSHAAVPLYSSMYVFPWPKSRAGKFWATVLHASSPQEALSGHRPLVEPSRQHSRLSLPTERPERQGVHAMDRPGPKRGSTAASNVSRPLLHTARVPPVTCVFPACTLCVQCRWRR